MTTIIIPRMVPRDCIVVVSSGEKHKSRLVKHEPAHTLRPTSLNRSLGSHKLTCESLPRRVSSRSDDIFKNTYNN